VVLLVDAGVDAYNDLMLVDVEAAVQDNS